MFWLYGIKENFVPFSQKIKTPFCYFEKNLNTPLSFTLKKVFAPLHSAPAPLYSKFFKPPKVTAVFRRRTCFFSVQIQKKNSYQISEMLLCRSRCFKNWSLTIIWNNLGPSYHKCMKRNLEFRKKNIFEETLHNKRSAKYSTQNYGMVERCHKRIRVRGLSFE